MLISVAAVGVVPGARRREAMQKCGYYPGIPRFLQVYPQNTRGILPISPISPQKSTRTLALWFP